MNIIVLIKPVPDLDKIKVSRGQGRVFETGKQIMNSYDRVALQVAMDFKQKHGAHVTAISICDMERTDILREAYAVGCDQCVCIWDGNFEFNDAFVNARILSEAIKKIDSADLIICGARSDTGFSGQTGPRLAEDLGMPHATRVISAELNGAILSLECLKGLKRTLSMPALITVDPEAAQPKLPNALNIMKAFKKEVTRWSLADLGMEPSDAGKDGSKVTVRSQFLVEQ
ncbi:hypothetical protein GF337_03555 [candidate division KSB1 bacterium]|nr:hypothetical protein [candidate division KSB1 bacterium]